MGAASATQRARTIIKMQMRQCLPVLIIAVALALSAETDQKFEESTALFQDEQELKQLVDPAFAPHKTGLPFNNKLKDFDFNKDNIKRRANQKTKSLIPSHKKCYHGCQEDKKACKKKVAKDCKRTKKKNSKLVTVTCHIKNGAGARKCDTAYSKCRRKCKKSKLMQEEQPALEQALQSCKKNTSAARRSTSA